MRVREESQKLAATEALFELRFRLSVLWQQLRRHSATPNRRHSVATGTTTTTTIDSEYAAQPLMASNRASHDN